MRLVVHTSIAEDEILRQQWNGLVNRISAPEIFYTYEWAVAVQRAYEVALHPLLVLGYGDDENLLGVAALARNGSSVSFLCATTGDYCDFVAFEEHKPEFVKSLLCELKMRGIREITLANLPASSTTLNAILESSAEHRFQCFSRIGYVCAQVLFEKLDRGKEGKPIAPGLKRLKRFAKAMGPESPIRTEHRRSWDAVEPVLPEFIEAHVGRFLEIGRISNLADPHRRIFLAELAKFLSVRQWVVLSRMLAGNKPVAWHYGFQFHGSWFWYQPTFDSSVEKHWPGFCLLSHVIQDAIENPELRTLDLGLGSEAYKAKFANASRDTLYVTLRKSRLRHYKEILRYRVAEGVRRRPRLEAFAGKFRNKLSELRTRMHQEGILSVLLWALRRSVRLVWARDEVVFYEGRDVDPLPLPSEGAEIQTLELRHLARAAMEYNQDEQTCSYLLRAARRLRSNEAQGYVLANERGTPLHFLWTASLEGFFSAELKTTVHADPNAVVLFDCWTPTAIRGHGYYEQSIRFIASTMKVVGKVPWIFSARSNVASTHGIEQVGFQRRYSIVRKGFLGMASTSPDSVAAHEPHPREVTARV